MAASGCTEKSLYFPENKQRKSFIFFDKFYSERVAAGSKWLQVAARKSHFIFRRKTTEKFYFFSINFIRKEWRQGAASGCTERSLYFPEKKVEKFFFDKL